MRQRLALLAAAVAFAGAAGCASQGMPPGGPPDTAKPVLLDILPDSNAVNVRAPAVVLRFDEVVNERSGPTSGGAASGGTQASSLSGLLVLSPSDGRDEVIWRREALELRARRGFRPNTAYRVTLQPGLTDLRGNRITEPFSFVFSTGPEIPQGTIAGVLFDWTTGRPAINARVDVWRPADSTFRWSARTDSLGRFRVRDLSPGDFELRAWMDANNDRRISFREISDSTRVSLRDTATLELYAYGRDTLPPRLEAVEWLDSTGVRIRLDRGIVADWDGRSTELVGADSVAIPLAGPFIPSAVYDSLARERAAAAQAVADSLAKLAADSAAADVATDSTKAAPPRPGVEKVVTAPRAPDTVRVENTRPAPRAAPARPPVAAPAPRDTGRTVVSDSLAADSSARPVFGRKVPVTQWSAPLTEPLAPGLYRFRIRDARGLNGRSLVAERELRVQPRRAPADTSATRRPTTDATATRPAADTTRKP